MKTDGIAYLENLSNRLAKKVIEMTTRAGSGHPSSSLSAIDLITVLYFGDILAYNKNDTGHPDRDRFILSKGHAAPALYACLAQAGIIQWTDLETFRKIGSPLEGHPNMKRLPGVEASTGSLGQGLSIAVGHALNARIHSQNYRVYCLVGDGETEEGQFWEAVMAAATFKLNNLTLIIDINGYQQTGAVGEIMSSLVPWEEKLRAFGWFVRVIDGHSISQISKAFDHVQNVNGQSQAIIAHTRKGRGLSPFESDDVNRKHGQALSPLEADKAYEELENWKGETQ